MSNTTERELEKRQEGHVASPETQVFPKTDGEGEHHAHAVLEDLVGEKTAADLRVTAAQVGNEPDRDVSQLKPDLHPTDTTAVVLEHPNGDPVSEPVTAAGSVDDEAPRAKSQKGARLKTAKEPKEPKEPKEAKAAQAPKPEGPAKEVDEEPQEHRNPKPAVHPLDLVGGGLRYVARQVRPSQKHLWNLPLRVAATELEMTASVLESKAAHGLESLVAGAVRLPLRVGRGAWSYGKDRLGKSSGKAPESEGEKSDAS